MAATVDIRRRRLSLLRSANPPLLPYSFPSSLPVDQGRQRGKVRSRGAVSLHCPRPSHADC